MRVQLMVEASGLVDVEMTEAQIAELEARGEDFPINLDDVPGVNMDDVLNQLDFEVDDFHVVTKSAAPIPPDDDTNGVNED